LPSGKAWADKRSIGSMNLAWTLGGDMGGRAQSSWELDRAVLRWNPNSTKPSPHLWAAFKRHGLT
jgi:hypothetical protein